MSTLAEIEAAVDALPLPDKKELLRRLAARVQQEPVSKRRLPLVPATGRRITQKEIDDACDAE